MRNFLIPGIVFVCMLRGVSLAADLDYEPMALYCVLAILLTLVFVNSEFEH